MPENTYVSGVAGSNILYTDDANRGDAMSEQVELISCEGLSPEDAKAVRELAEELLPFSPIPLPRLSREQEEKSTAPQLLLSMQRVPTRKAIG